MVRREGEGLNIFLRLGGGGLGEGWGGVVEVRGWERGEWKGGNGRGGEGAAVGVGKGAEGEEGGGKRGKDGMGDEGRVRGYERVRGLMVWVWRGRGRGG